MTSACAHCGSPPPATRDDGYCCDGCAAVAGLLREEGMADRYYALGGGRGAPARPIDGHEHLWLDGTLAQLRDASSPTTVELDAQGIHCSACVWAFETLFRREDGAHTIVVDPTLGRVTMRVSPAFDLARWITRVEGLGYALGPAEKARSAESSALLVRTGVAIAIAMNVMSFALAEYLGLSEEPLRTTLRTISIVLTGVSVALGAPPFVRGALGGLRARVLTLDLPIALGMILVAIATIRSFVVTGEPVFADTLSVFVALMLLGRVLEERSLGRARRQLLSGDAPRLFVRRVEDGVLAVIPAERVVAGDVLRVAPGDALPVDGELLEDTTIALDWVSGESDPHRARRGDRVVAGTLAAAGTPMTVRATRDYSASSLHALFARPAAPTEAAGFESAVSRFWTAAVLVAAGLTFALWLALDGSIEHALRATTAVLVVTCPCGIGIATPLARELARAQLRREGLFVRTSRTLAVASTLERVAFDKTGTLTTGRPELADVRPLLALRRSEQAIVAAMTAQSAHPRSVAVHQALSHVDADASVRAEEHPGKGVEATVDGRTYRVGSPIFVGGGAGDVVVARDGEILAELSTTERLKVGVEDDVAALRALGLEVSLLSGDRRDRALAAAARAGIAAGDVVAEARPDDKARWLEAHDAAHTLFVGDGLNDLPAAGAAALSGTPAIDRPFLSARTDFYFTTPGVRPIVRLVEIARDVRSVARRNAAFALVYNVVAIAIAAGGAMSPWLAAILMPLSSLVVIGSSVASLAGAQSPRAHVARERGELAWKS